MRDLSTLLRELDPQAGLAQRHLWLIWLFGWIRGDQASPEAALSRVQLFLDALDANPELQERLQAWWLVLAQTVDITTLLADFGFAPRTAFVSELAERLRRKLLPGTPETTDAAELFLLALPTQFDALWLALLDAPMLGRLAHVLSGDQPAGRAQWQQIVLEAINYCMSQIVAAGYAPELRLRMSEPVRMAQPFHALGADLDALRLEVLRQPRIDAQLQAALQQFRERLDACRHAAATVYTHLEDNGISVGLVFRLRQLRERVLRVRELLDCLLSATPAASAARLMARLVTAGREHSSIRALIASNSSLLAAKVAERSAETGEHYITRNRREYAAMLRQAAGGGAFMSLTTLLKFVVLSLGLSIFWGGFFAGLNYAVSFVMIQLLHWTVATKQPAMTAPAMAAKLKELSQPGAIESFVDEVAHLVRSQVAAVLGNLALVFPGALGLSLLVWLVLGRPMIDTREADYVFHSLSLLGPTALFAAFTGVLLFASSIVAGWVENWFVLHRLDSALRYNPRITAALGSARAARWAAFMRKNISGFASNVSLGFMLGLIPAFAAFFGLGLEVRHVTLSTGQIAAACATYGPGVLQMPALWWCLAGVLVTGPLNVGVSFYCAFRLALRAHNVSGVARAQIRAAIWARWRHAPLSFFFPPRDADPPPSAPA
ncbi:MAG: site-specific recombinase [Rhodoferax sp.]|nr:site-specific recombinase [Rhodoferax sp.]